MVNELSIELSYEDIRTAIVKLGFLIEVNKRFSSILSADIMFMCMISELFVFPTGGERVHADHLHRKRALYAKIRL